MMTAQKLAIVLVLFCVIPLPGQVSNTTKAADPLLICRRLLESGRGIEAEEKLREYLRVHPDSERAVVLHALALVQLRQPSNAISELESYLREKPDSLIALKAYAGLLTSAARNPAKAEAVLSHCARLAPRDIDVWRALGAIYLSQVKSKEAIQAFTKAASLAPRNPEVAAALAYSYGQADQAENAAEWFEKASALDSSAAKPSPVAPLLYGEYLLRRDRPAEALPLLAKALLLDPHSAEAYAWRALCYERLQSLQKAEADAVAALRESENRRDALQLLLRLYKAQNRPAKIEETAARIQNLDAQEYRKFSGGRSLGEQLRKADSSLSGGRPDEAARYYEEIVRVLPSFDEGYFALGMCYSRIGKFPQAESALRRYLELQPLSADGLAALGTLFVQQGRYREALPSLRQSLALYPEQPDVGKTLAQAYISEAEVKKATDELEKLLRTDPKSDPQLYVLLTRCHLLAGDESGSVETIDRGARYFQNVVDYWRGVAGLLFEFNPDGTLTAETVKKLVKRFSGDAASRVLFADWAYKKADYDLCREELKAADSLNPDDRTRIRSLALSAMIEGNRNRQEAAEPLFRQSYAINRKLLFPDKQSAMAYVEFLERYQRDQEAQQCVNEILSVVPGLGAARLSRARYLAKRGKNESAIEEARFALAAAGNNYDLQRTLHALMARTLFALGRTKEAQEHQAWIEKNTKQ